MPVAIWRSLAVAFSVLLFAMALVDAVDPDSYSATHLRAVPAQSDRLQPLRVTYVDGTAAENGGLVPGDLITLDGPFNLRAINGDVPIGTRITWNVARGATTFRATTVTTTAGRNDVIEGIVYAIVRLALLAVAILVALRRPDEAAARALVTFLAILGFAIFGGGIWLPDGLYQALYALRNPLQTFGFSQLLVFACLFPERSQRGPRAWLLKINPWYTAVLTAVSAVDSVRSTYAGGNSMPQAVHTAVLLFVLAYLVASVVAFALAARDADGRNRRRLAWAGGSIAVGFSGPLLQSLFMFALHWYSPALNLLGLTIIAMPAGLAYTILRHRMVDVGFVVSRALVLTAVSFLIVAAFGLVERSLGKIFIDMSHIASRSVEIALAIGLGFSLRALHVRIERGVDYVFFRKRRRSLKEMRAFGRDVFQIGDPAIVVARLLELLEDCADASGAVLLDEETARGDDPLLVRLRATRAAVKLADVKSDFHGEMAFPMYVRGTLAGVLIVDVKNSGEAYDPEEREVMAEIAARTGIALDALQTQAVRAELDALRARLSLATGGAVSAF